MLAKIIDCIPYSPCVSTVLFVKSVIICAELFQHQKFNKEAAVLRLTATILADSRTSKKLQLPNCSLSKPSAFPEYTVAELLIVALAEHSYILLLE